MALVDDLPQQGITVLLVSIEQSSTEWAVRVFRLCLGKVISDTRSGSAG